jgi:hypothetical protein
VGDDGLLLEVQAGRLLARPHPRIAGLLEVRNLGCCPSPTAPRLWWRWLYASIPPRRAISRRQSCGARRGVPSLVRLWPDTPMLALRATLALDRYGAQDSYGLA